MYLVLPNSSWERAVTLVLPEPPLEHLTVYALLEHPWSATWSTYHWFIDHVYIVGLRVSLQLYINVNYINISSNVIM